MIPIASSNESAEPGQASEDAQPKAPLQDVDQDCSLPAVVLSPEESMRLLESLDAPFAPNEKLAQAMDRARRVSR